jgi:glycosyltransferase involved in cell wall biosynthesis
MKKTLLLINIVSNNNVHKVHNYQTANPGEAVKVIFCAHSEANRRWKLTEKPKFKYQILDSKAIQLKGADLFTYFINPSIWGVLNNENPGKVVVCGWDILSYQLAILWAKLHRKHLTIWSGSTAYETSWRRTVSLPLVKLFVFAANDYIAYGTRAKQYLKSLGADHKKITIIQNDVNGEYFKRQASRLRPKKKLLKKKFRLKSNNRYLIFVGQFIQRKGVLSLLETYRQLKPKFPNWGLILVGYGQLENQIREYIKMHTLSDTHLLGSIDQYKLPEAYAVSDILVLPSGEEVWGLVANEALHSGLKVVISSKCGASQDLAENKNVFIYNPDKATHLNRAVMRAIKS